MKLRPQILAVMIALGGSTGYAMFLGHIEVATACIGGLTAIAMKIMESE